MNVFNAVEIYKRIPGVSPANNPLRAVRGFWVSGTHTEPFFIDSIISISTTCSGDIEVVQYTSRDQYVEVDNALFFDGIYDEELPITEYTSVDQNVTSSEDLSIVTFHIDDLTATAYLTYYNDAPSDGPIIEVAGFDQPQTVTFTSAERPSARDEGVGLEPILKVLIHSSTELEYN